MKVTAKVTRTITKMLAATTNRGSILSLLVIVCSACTLSAQTGTAVDVQPGLDTASQIITPQPPIAPLNVLAEDTPNDAGNSMDIRWELASDDSARITKYQVMRSDSPDGPFTVVGETTKGQATFTDNTVEPGKEYYYKVISLGGPIAGSTTEFESSESEVFGPSMSSGQWFNSRRLNVFFWTILLSASVIFYIYRAKGGGQLYIRKIAGIDAIDEAIGRATEMGRKVFYVPGINDMDDVQTLASIAILGRVARLAAESDTYLEVPVSKSLVLITARETVKEAYSKVGRPDSFREEQVHYVTDDQLGYAAAIDGMVVRQKPATMIYMGAFYAESLILAETGNAAGAIQIAGTAQPAQLPFFVAACDYTLIGEELFAASAYLSREPKLLGSLKGQDVGKALFLASIVLGIILELMSIDFQWLLRVS